MNKKEPNIYTEFYGQTIEISENDFNSLEDFKDDILDQYAGLEVVDCELKDLSLSPFVSDDGLSSFIFIVGGKEYHICYTGIKALCKILKIPSKFATMISTPLFRDTFEEMKMRFDQPVKLITSQKSLNKNSKAPCIIRNIVTGHKEYAERYIFSLIEYLESAKHLLFHSATVSEFGYRINFITPEKDDQDSIWIENTEYRLGLSFSGDIYRLKPYFQVDYLLVHTSDDSKIVINNYEILKLGSNQETSGKRFKITSSKEIEDGNEFTQSLIELLKESFEFFNYRVRDDLDSVLKTSNEANLSLWKFFSLRSKLKKVIESQEQVDSLLLSESEEIKLLKDQVKEIKKKTTLADRDRVLKTTPIEKCNALVIFNNIINYQSTTRMEEFNIINDQAVSILFDTYNTNTKK